MKYFVNIIVASLLLCACTSKNVERPQAIINKIVVYKTDSCSIGEDYDVESLGSIKCFGVSHIWFPRDIEDSVIALSHELGMKVLVGYSPASIPTKYDEMREEILLLVDKGIDGFFCTNTEQIPLDFWHHVISNVKVRNPEVKFFAETNNPKQYIPCVKEGGFDYIFDKLELNDVLKHVKSKSIIKDRFIGYMPEADRSMFGIYVLCNSNPVLLNCRQKLLYDSNQEGIAYVEKVMNLATTSHAIRYGEFIDLMPYNKSNKTFDQEKMYAFARVSDLETVIVVANFSNEEKHVTLKLDGKIADKELPAIVQPNDIMVFNWRNKYRPRK